MHNKPSRRKITICFISCSFHIAAMELRMVSWMKTLLDDFREVSPHLALSIYRNRHLTHPPPLCQGPGARYYKEPRREKSTVNTSRDSGLRADATAVEGLHVASGPLDTNAESYPDIKEVVSPLHARVGRRLGREATMLVFSLNFKIGRWTCPEL